MRIAACAVCDMLTTSMKVTLNVSTTDNVDLYIWIWDLNKKDTSGRPVVALDGKKLHKGDPPETAQLEQDVNGKVSYQWSAEQNLNNQVLHWTDVVGPEAVDASRASLTQTINLAPPNKSVVLPYMFRAYP